MTTAVYHIDQQFPPGLRRRIWAGRLLVPLTYFVMLLPLLALLLSLFLPFFFGNFQLAAVIRGPAILFSMIGILYNWVVVIRSAFAPLVMRTPVEPVILLDPEKEPELADLIGEICAAAGSKYPSHILLHMGPELFVMQGRLRLPAAGTVRGRLLVIGFPLLDYLSRGELKAVLTHEMAHFSGDDTVYSAFVYPVYVTLRAAVEGGQGMMTRRRNVYIKLMIAPQLWVFRHYQRWFRANNLPVTRFREHRADFIAAMVCGRNNFSSGLQRCLQVKSLYQTVRTALENGEPLRSPFYTHLKARAGQVNRMEPETDEDHPSEQERLEFIRTLAVKPADARPAAAMLRHYYTYEQQLETMQQTVLDYQKRNREPLYGTVLAHLNQRRQLHFVFASVAKRVGALCVDFAVTGILTVWVQDKLSSDQAGFVFWGTWILYNILLERFFRQSTIGKMLFRMRVCGYDGQPVSLFRSAKRNFCKLLCFLSVGSGGLQAVFDPQKQMLHDRLAWTLVVLNKNK